MKEEVISDDATKLGVLERMLDGFDRHDLDTIMSQWTLTGTTVSGELLDVRGCDVWTFRGDQIVRKDSCWKIVEP